MNSAVKTFLLFLAICGPLPKVGIELAKAEDAMPSRFQILCERAKMGGVFAATFVLGTYDEGCRIEGPQYVDEQAQYIKELVLQRERCQEAARKLAK